MRRSPIEPVTHVDRKERSDRPLALSIGVALGVKAVALAILYFAFFVPPAALAPLASAVFGAPAISGGNGRGAQ